MTLFRELSTLLFEIRRASKETARSLEESDATTLRQADETIELTKRLESLESERDVLRQQNEALRREIATLRADRPPTRDIED